MAWTGYQIFLAILMVVTGSINTISVKWANETKSKGRDGEVKKFSHPFFQAALMFLGEFLCFIVFKSLYKIYSIKSASVASLNGLAARKQPNHELEGLEDVKELTRGNRSFNPFVLMIPAICDMAATSVMFLGLTLTYASSFQMLRGSVIVFVGLLSMIFLHRKLRWIRWVGIAFVIIGLTLVGVADFLSQNTSSNSHSQSDIVIGDILIVLAQIVTATQMVVEEKFVTGQDIPPLQAVGWEGIFGIIVIGFVHIIFYFIRADPPMTLRAGDRLEDAIDASTQIGNNWELMVATLILVLSIAFFNFAGISVTKELSAVTRMMLDSVRTIVIWIFSLTCFEQKFHWLQLVGFILLVIGMCLYNEITCGINFKKKSRQTEGETNTKAEATQT